MTEIIDYLNQNSDSITFTKMHGLGNDYIVINLMQPIDIITNSPGDCARILCNRHRSIGADGLILVMESKVADYRMRIINADGSEAEMCGNGIRCFALYCYTHELINKMSLTVETLAGIKEVSINNTDQKSQGSHYTAHVSVEMGTPIFDPPQIPFILDKSYPDKPYSDKLYDFDYQIQVDQQIFKGTAVSVGNPHFIILVPTLKDLPIESVGPQIEKHEAFPERINVSFVEIIDNAEVRARVWERGVGETSACGTAATAIAAVYYKKKLTNKKIVVSLPGGRLDITCMDDGKMILAGSAESVFEGKILLSQL